MLIRLTDYLDKVSKGLSDEQIQTMLLSEHGGLKYLKPVYGKPQTFIAPDLIHPATFKNLELIPFYKLHDARYMIYWRY